MDNLKSDVDTMPFVVCFETKCQSQVDVFQQVCVFCLSLNEKDPTEVLTITLRRDFPRERPLYCDSRAVAQMLWVHAAEC